MLHSLGEVKGVWGDSLLESNVNTVYSHHTHARTHAPAPLIGVVCVVMVRVCVRAKRVDK